MKQIFTYFLFLCIFSLNAQNHSGDERRDSIPVTIKELLLNPKKYNEKYIAVSGFIILEKKGISAIYSSEEDYKNESERSFWLSFFFESSTFQTSSYFNKKNAIAVGWFNSGHWTSKNEYLGKEIETKNGMISDLRFYDK